MKLFLNIDQNVMGCWFKFQMVEVVTCRRILFIYLIRFVQVTYLLSLCRWLWKVPKDMLVQYPCQCAKILCPLQQNWLYYWKVFVDIQRILYLTLVSVMLLLWNLLKVLLFVLLERYQAGQVQAMSFQDRQVFVVVQAFNSDDSLWYDLHN